MTATAFNRLPKALLHDHLDGGLRVDTILDLADDAGYDQLPSADAAALAQWFHQADSGSLERYLEAFRHTTGVMQTEEALERVAYEAVVDISADGVVYAELRFAPGLHTSGGLDRRAVVEAVLAGLGRGRRETGMIVGLIVAALRTDHDSADIARVAAEYRDRGVVAFDLAGAEAGYPADDHLVACRYAREMNLGLTIHAGEGDGPDSIWRAVARCGAQRIGHGVRIVDDCVLDGGDIAHLGSLAQRICDHRVPLEIAVTSNVDTGTVASAADHPLGALFRAGFAVTINTDNRLMSDVTLSDEYERAATLHGLAMPDLLDVTETALRAGFAPWSERKRLLNDVVRPAYAAAVSPSPA